MPETQIASDDLSQKTLAELARVIHCDWKHVYFGAVPYLRAMRSLQTITDYYGADDAKTIVTYFLANANAWRGPIARAVKAELKRRIGA